ncbi:tyrosine-type recombinase/integrase [Paraburkholderia dipogonis]|uniref:tyrosine-type recombinase/integrase n=1 Tax=Paraburkholderia dipogonis TaxID=1211383 RepID=UPI00361C9F8E
MAVWITLATLVRINEICTAQWRAHINFEKATWFKPASQSKNRNAFTIHLSAFALRLLRKLTGHTAYMLPHTKHGDKPLTTAILKCEIGSRQSHGKKWTGKFQYAEMTALPLVLYGGPWSWHDLRRTGATLMQACGIDESLVDRCLNHSHSTMARNKRVDPRLLKARADGSRRTGRAVVRHRQIIGCDFRGPITGSCARVMHCMNPRGGYDRPFLFASHLFLFPGVVLSSLLLCRAYSYSVCTAFPTLCSVCLPRRSLLSPASRGLFSRLAIPHCLSGFVLRQSSRCVAMRNTYLDFVLRICDCF